MSMILTLIFRRIRWVLLPIMISVTGALFMTGLISAIGWKVTVISANFFSLLLVMTLSVTIHLVVRFRELSKNNPDKETNDLTRETLEQMIKPCAFTTITTIAAFISLTFSNVQPVIDFGLMMSIGISIALLLSGDTGNKIINFQDYNAQTIGIILLWLSAALTLFTGYDYMRKGIDHAMSEDNKD